MFEFQSSVGNYQTVIYTNVVANNQQNAIIIAVTSTLLSVRRMRTIKSNEVA